MARLSGDYETIGVMKKIFVDVALPQALPQLTYRWSLQQPPRPGMEVRVPLRQKVVAGIIVAVHSKERSGLKDVLEIFQDQEPLDQSLLDYAHFLSEYYGCFLGEILHAMISQSMMDKEDVYWSLGAIDRVEQWKKDHPRAYKAHDLLDAIKEEKEILKPKKNNLVTSYQKDWKCLGVIEEKTKKRDQRRCLKEKEELKVPELSAEQDCVYHQIKKKSHGFHVHLVHGVTGSGKTELYIKLAYDCLKEQKTVMFLCPEIALVEHLKERLQKHFGERALCLHSDCTKKERREIEWKIRHSSGWIVIGTRLISLLPMKNLALIIVDEEHDASYKQDENPRYHARDAVIARSHICDIPIVLGSATPSIESYKNAMEGKYDWHQLKERYGGVALPETFFVDMRDCRKKNFFLSEPLYREIEKTLKNGEQSLLFINRRGSASTIFCENCGESVFCDYCDVTLTYHQNKQELKCHYCGRSRPYHLECSSCRKKTLKAWGIGTQHVLQTMEKMFPQAKVLCMDTDSVTKKNEREKMMAAISKNDVNIIVGTQMMAKGFDFPSLKLVAILLAETNLIAPDFRSAEKAFQMISQVSGRAGRHQGEGRTFIQTYKPGAPVFRWAVGGQYEDFMKEEMQIRKRYSYPPYSRMIQLILKGKNEKKVLHVAGRIKKHLQTKWSGVWQDVLGPAPFPIAYINKVYRYQILMKIDKKRNFIHVLQEFREKREIQGVKVLMNTDPYGMV